MSNTLGYEQWCSCIFGDFLLTTKQADAISEVPFLSGPGITAWQAVKLELAVPYLLITYASLRGASWSSETSIYWENEDVLALCQGTAAHQARRLIEVAAILPRNGGGGWRLVTVHKIFRDKLWTGRPMVIYMTSCGEIFGGKLGVSTHICELDGMEQVYSAQ